MLICYYYYNTVHISFYLEVILTSKVQYLHYVTGAFSLWSKDACVLNDEVAQKRWGGGGITLRGVSYIIYDDNKPPSSYKRRGMNSQIYISNIYMM